MTSQYHSKKPVRQWAPYMNEKLRQGENSGLFNSASVNPKRYRFQILLCILKICKIS